MPTVPEKLVFAEPSLTGDNVFLTIPVDPQIGTVGWFAVDRIPNGSDIFIVVDSEWSFVPPPNGPLTHKITAIFPRMREEDGNIFFGQDRTTERWQSSFECSRECLKVTQSDEYCSCGAEHKIKEEYEGTFQQMPKDYNYNSLSFVHCKFREFNHVYHEHISRSHIKYAVVYQEMSEVKISDCD